MIITIKFKEPFPRAVPGLLQHGMPMVEFIDELTCHADELPRIVHYRDGHKSGYLRIEKGVEFRISSLIGFRVVT